MTAARRLAILAIAALPASVAAQAPVPVAVSAAAAPGGGSYTGFRPPTVNAAGQVAFHADTTAGGGGVFAGGPGAVQAAARAVAGPTAPAVNTTGQVAFSGGSDGVFVGNPGAVQAAARAGGAAPGGGAFTGFNSPVVSAAGQVAFHANTNSGGDGVFAGSPESVQAVARAGGEAPGGGGAYTGFGTAPAVGGGRVAFLANIDGGRAGVFVGGPDAVQAVARTGHAAPGGGTFAGFGTAPAVGAAGHVAFTADTVDGGGGVFVGTPGTVQAVARLGGAAPDVGGGTRGTFTQISYSVAVNAAGQAAFTASAGGDGVYVGGPGQVRAAARSGGAAPGGGEFAYFNSPALNAAGQAAFLATLTGDGVTFPTDRGLFAWDPAGGLALVVREGQLVDVDPTAGVSLRTVADNGIGFETGIGYGRGGFADNGWLAYHLTFTDGSSGVFVSQFAPVPEPATVGLLAAAGLGVAGWVRRRRTRVVA